MPGGVSATNSHVVQGSIAKWVSATCCLLTILFCLLLTFGYHTHCSYEYSIDSCSNSICATISNWNGTFLSRYNSTVFDILYFLHESPSWSPHCNKRLTRITQPNPSTSPLPSAPSTCWEIFDQWRNWVLREANKALETSNSISTRINEDPDWLPLFVRNWLGGWRLAQITNWLLVCSPVQIPRQSATNFCTLPLPYLNKLGAWSYQCKNLYILIIPQKNCQVEQNFNLFMEQNTWRINKWLV